MLKNDYRYALELFRPDHTPLGQAPVEVDWEPAREWTRLQALRRGRYRPTAVRPRTSIQPIWHRTAGEPYVEGFRVSITTNGAEEISRVFTTAYFKRLANRASTHFVEQGALKPGESFRYLAAAYPRQPDRSETPTVRFQAQEIEPPLLLKQSSLTAFRQKSVPLGLVNEADMSVFIPHRALQEAAALSQAAGAVETGGVLIGHLHRDSSLPDLFVEVRAQIPARHTQAELTRLTFTAETWTEVRAALELRRKGEIMLGWWHSHPAREWCKDCPLERQRVCRLSRDFFSQHDQALHRTLFPRAYSIGLVVNVVAPTVGDPTFSLFGWRQGLLEARGFQLLG